MQLKVDEVSDKKTNAYGDYYPIKSDGKTYNVKGWIPKVGELLECDVNDSKYVRNGKQAVSHWATVIKAVPPPKERTPGGAVDWFDYCKLAEYAHGMASVMEPDGPAPCSTDGKDKGFVTVDRSQARAAIVNTACIAFANGKIALPEPPPDDSDEPPYPDELK